ncbi:MAG: RdgB/HAM1 family non-canonical purine NTP pyrophosphatase [Chthoniobacterales bacterium]
MKQRLLLSTRNAHKLREVREILSDFAEVVDLSVTPDMPGVEETGTTFMENAALKALAGSTHFEGWVLADDSGLEVDALDGAPGVFSARFAGPDANDADNRRLLIEKLKDVPQEARGARFRCALVLAKNGKRLAECEGSVEGSILFEERGSSGFGYDPLFVPEGFSESFAELSPEAKNRLSHRGRALQSLKEWFASNSERTA